MSRPDEKQRGKELEKLATGVRRCRKCRLHQSRTHAVPGEGDPDAKIMMIGEAPGEVEDAEGLPFRGRSGRFLDKLLADVGLRREKLFITSSVKCRPPENRNPKRDEFAICRAAWLEGQIELVRPKIIVLMGLTAIRCVLDETPRLTDVHGQVRQDAAGRRCLLTYHPTAGMRFPHAERRMRRDLRRLSG